MFASLLINTLIIGELLLNPKVKMPDTYYPSGIKEEDSFYSTDKPSKKYPLFKLDVAGYDTEFNKIGPGIYPVEYSPQENMLLIGSGDNLVKSPVFQIIKTKSKVYVPSVEVAFVKNKKIFIIYKNEYLEIQSFLYTTEAVLDNN